MHKEYIVFQFSVGHRVRKQFRKVENPVRKFSQKKGLKILKFLGYIETLVQNNQKKNITSEYPHVINVTT